MVLEEKSMEAQILRDFLLKVKQQKQQVGGHLMIAIFFFLQHQYLYVRAVAGTCKL